MKKSIVFPIILLLLAGCSDREFTPEDINNGPTESSFMSVSIVASGIGTRAATELENGDYEKDDGYYRDGTSDESYVNEVLFLFFNDNGDPTRAFKDPTSGSYQTYYLWQVTEDSNNNAGPNHDETVEKILKETIHISVPHNQAKPTQLLAVVNPTATHKTSLTNKKLSELRDIVEDYEFDENANNSKLSTRGKFVMTNSVYYEATDKNKEIIYTTKIKSTDYHDSEVDAEKNPIIVYVERVLARIDLQIAIQKTNDKDPKPINDGADHIYYTGVNFPEGVVEGDDNGIYVHFLGWNVFDTPTKSRLIKSIDLEWTNKAVFGSETLLWNSDNFHRSFWAVNPPASRFEYKRGAFKEKDGENSGENVKSWVATANQIPRPGSYVTAYFQENAAPYEPDATTTDNTYGKSYPYVTGAPVQPSKVILAAQLVDASGKSHELAKYAGLYYTWETLKTVICSKLNLYYVSETESDSNGNTRIKYSRIKPEHLTYTPNENSNTVKITLKDASKTWYTGSNQYDMTQYTGDVENYINTTLGENSVRVWSEGYTYFYFTIRHLGRENSPGYYGIVRNHIYDAKVTSISGLGTPVPQPDDVIVPQPDEDTGILAAQVRILSWRLVSQQYDLNW